MAFLSHPRTRLRRAANTAALAASGLKAATAPGFQGKLVYPGDPDYETDRQIFNPAFQGFPKLIAYCASESDIAWCLATAQHNNWPVVCRSGGHSTAGFSTIDNGLLIDLSNFNFVQIDWLMPPPAGQGPFVLVGPGAPFEKVNSTLSEYGIHIPGGGCGDVCMGGYMQGGGYGFTSREFGMHCDNVVGFTMMLADGEIVIATPETNGDLFWAVRGGTGNNFGVLLGATYKSHELPSVFGVWLQWPMSSAAQALVEMQTNFMQSGAPSNFGYMTILAEQQGVPVLMMRAMYDGSESDLMDIIAPLLAIPGAGPPQPPPDSPVVFPLVRSGTYYEMNTALLEGPYGIPQLPDGSPIGWGEDKQAGYIPATKILQQSDWQKILDYYLKGSSIPGRILVIEPYGGAINQGPASPNAFIHRDKSMDIFMDVFWDPDAIAGKLEAEKWLNGFNDLLNEYVDGSVYQNYPRRTIVDYAAAYWGDAYPTLQFVKQKYDPTNFFRFPQSIQPAIQATKRRLATKADAFLDKPIVYASKKGR
jgi:FAD/FMN-containing dehydrogenase